MGHTVLNFLNWNKNISWLNLRYDLHKRAGGHMQDLLIPNYAMKEVVDDFVSKNEWSLYY